MKLENTKDIEQMENRLSDAIKAATYTINHNKKNGKYWWNEDIAKLWQIKKKEAVYKYKFI